MACEIYRYFPRTNSKKWNEIKIAFEVEYHFLEAIPHGTQGNSIGV